MTVGRKTLFSTITILSIIGYGFVVFAVAPVGGYAPGETLDPVGCSPGDVDCNVRTALTIGSSVISGMPNQVLYTDASGDVAGDDNFIWDATNSNFAVGAPFLGSTGVSMILNSQASLAGILTDGSFKIADRDIKNVFDLNVVTNEYKIGDLDNANNSTVFTVDDDARTISANALDVGVNTFASSVVSATGNTINWDANTNDSIIDGLLQGNNLNGVGYKGNALAHYDTSTYESAAFFAGDTTSAGGKPYEASMSYVLPGGINGAFAYQVNSDGLRSEYYNIAGNIKSNVNQYSTGNTISWDADTTDTISTGLYQSQSVFGLPIIGTASGYSDNNFTTSMSGIISGDFSGIGSADNAVMSGFVSFAGGAMASDHYSYDLATDTARIEMKAVSSTNMAQVRVKVVGTTPEIVFDYGGTNKYTFPTSDGTTGYLLATDGSGQLFWQDPTMVPSDRSLKSNINELSYGLDTLMQLRPVSYTMNSSSKEQIGFIAQEVESLVPELVGEVANGKKGLAYGQMTAVIVKSVQELDLKITNIEAIATLQNKTFLNNLITWFADTANGIEKLFAAEIETKKLCVADNAGSTTCITKSQLDALLLNQSNGSGNNVPTISHSDNQVDSPVPSPDPGPTPAPDPTPTPAPDPGPTPVLVNDPITVIPDPIPDPVVPVVNDSQSITDPVLP